MVGLFACFFSLLGVSYRCGSVYMYAYKSFQWYVCTLVKCKYVHVSIYLREWNCMSFSSPFFVLINILYIHFIFSFDPLIPLFISCHYFLL